ncbi:MAG: TadE/TadG family type IV pilus assembly protein [Rhodospirillales bacterium]
MNGPTQLPERIRSFRRNRRGVTAVEFALVAPVFLYLLIGIFEVALMMFGIAMVETAAQNAARQLLTGTAQSSGDAEAAFQTELCNNLTVVYDCNDIILDVRTYASFTAVTIPDIKINGNGDLVYEDGDNDDSNDVLFTAEFSAGGASEIMVVRAIYSWDFATPYIGTLIGDSSGRKSLQTTVVFRSEPYQ